MDLAGHGKIRKFSSDCFLLFSKLKSQVISSEVKGVSRENVRFPRREEEGMKYFSHMVESKLTEETQMNSTFQLRL